MGLSLLLLLLFSCLATLPVPTTATLHFVLFHAPWNRYSQRMSELFDELAESLPPRASAAGGPVDVRQVACTEPRHQALCAALGIRGYPAIRSFARMPRSSEALRKGLGLEDIDVGEEYRGSRALGGFQDFIAGRAGVAIVRRAAGSSGGGGGGGGGVDQRCSQPPSALGGGSNAHGDPRGDDGWVRWGWNRVLEWFEVARELVLGYLFLQTVSRLWNLRTPAAVPKNTITEAAKLADIIKVKEATIADKAAAEAAGGAAGEGVAGEGVADSDGGDAPGGEAVGGKSGGGEVATQPTQPPPNTSCGGEKATGEDPTCSDDDPLRDDDDDDDDDDEEEEEEEDGEDGEEGGRGGDGSEDGRVEEEDERARRRERRARN